MPKTSVTFQIDPSDLPRVEGLLSDYQALPPTPYIRFHAKIDGNSLSIYHGGKCLIQGKDCRQIAARLGYEVPQEEEEEPKRHRFPLSGQIGSDEVGTGDAFGPIIVVGAYVEKKDLPYLKELGITDSKLLSDEAILALGPKLINRFDYSALTLDNPKYNEVHRTNNLNQIKAKMHNRVLLNLSSRHPQAEVTIDQFCLPTTYYKYLKGEEKVQTGIVFSTKGELAFPAVALASVIARYSFLRHMEKLSKEFGEDIPLGAGPNVEEFAKKVIQERGEEVLNAIAKTDFKTFTKIK